MTLTQLYDAIRIRMGLPALDGMMTGAVLIDLMNEGLQMVSTEHDWPWLQGIKTFVTEANVNTYDPPTNVGHVWVKTLALTPTGYDPLTSRSLIEMREYEANTSTTTPDSYCIVGDKIMLSPTPPAGLVITHDYITYEPELVDLQDTPLMPRQWHYSIVHAAAMLGHLRQNEGERADLERRQYDMWLKRMHDDLRRSKGSRSVRVRPGSML